MITNNVLHKYARNDTSQHGEDGITEEILNRLNITRGTVVDLGAADGKWFSNTYSLLCRGFDVYGIERDGEKFKKLQELGNEYRNLYPIRAAINIDDASPNHINNVLYRNKIRSIDYMSIDIDSYDAWIFRDLDVLPKVVVIECNPFCYPLHEMWYDSTKNDKTNPPRNVTSFYAMYKIAKRKGYSLICHCSINLFFLRNDMKYEFASPEVTEIDDLSNFDSRFLSPSDKLKWKEYQR